MTFEKDSSDTKGITFCLILRGRKEPLALAFLHQHLKHARWELLYQIPLGVGRKQKVKKNFNLKKLQFMDSLTPAFSAMRTTIHCISCLQIMLYLI